MRISVCVVGAMTLNDLRTLSNKTSSVYAAGVLTATKKYNSVFVPTLFPPVSQGSG